MVICPCLGGEAMILRQFDQIKRLMYDLCVHALTYYIFAPYLRVINARGQIAVIVRMTSPADGEPEAVLICGRGRVHDQVHVAR